MKNQKTDRFILDIFGLAIYAVHRKAELSCGHFAAHFTIFIFCVDCFIKALSTALLSLYDIKTKKCTPIFVVPCYLTLSSKGLAKLKYFHGVFSTFFVFGNGNTKC